MVEPLTDEQLRALIKACRGTELGDHRNEGIIRLMAETGLRAGEVVGIEVGDLDLERSVAVRRGKGGRGRRVPVLPGTGTAIDR